MVSGLVDVDWSSYQHSYMVCRSAVYYQAFEAVHDLLAQRDGLIQLWVAQQAETTANARSGQTADW